MKYRKKPVVIDAVLYDGSKQSVKEIIKMNGLGRGINNTEEGLYISTLEGNMLANKGDYIIKGVKGELYPCKPDIFLETYTLICDECSTSSKLVAEIKLDSIDLENQIRNIITNIDKAD